jgi:FMN phosphatase YigB (HAD superfamily)
VVPHPVDEAPAAVLLDAGGVFVLPEHERVLGAFERGGWVPSADVLDAAHYRAAAGFGVDADAEADWVGCWERYLRDYVAACGAPALDRDEIHQHVDSEFADAALWCQVIDGAVDGLRAIAATGVLLGVVSNADGVMGERLRELEVLQVGPGVGVPVACVIDSGAVGVMKPDPRIFHLALDVLDVPAHRVWFVGDTPGIDVVGSWRAGVRPFLVDPLGLHHDAGYDRIASLAELAERITRAGECPAHRFSLAAAAAAAREGCTPLWVGDFLASHGSDNVVLAAALAQRPHWWLGPVRVPLRALVRLAGPEDGLEWHIDPAEWEHEVQAMGDELTHGWEPPPLLAQWTPRGLLLHDGSHRLEALRRAGAHDAWALVWFDDEADRHAFAARWGLPLVG